MSLEVREDNTAKAADGIRAALDRALEKIGMKAERYARNLAPRDTGRLQNSITHTIDSGEKAAYIGTNVEYAPYQEFGTSKYKGANGGKGFLRPAASDHAAEYRAMVESELKGK